MYLVQDEYHVSRTLAIVKVHCKLCRVRFEGTLYTIDMCCKTDLEACMCDLQHVGIT